MIGRTHAKKEIMRLSSKHFFPRNQQQALNELVDALQSGATSEQHATMVISEAIDTSKGCPDPAEIKALCVRLGTECDRYPDPCDQCRPHEGNWRMIVVKVPAGYGNQAYMAEALIRCECPRGQLLAAREDEERRRMA